MAKSSRLLELKIILKRLLDQGWRVQQTNSKHFMCYAPNGVDTVLVAASGDPRGLQNARSRLRRYGAAL